eukprot:PhF_6_TR31490/c0_g1_i2/m.46329/K00690/E2.4.1.7; sucrose phosphorylase
MFLAELKELYLDHDEGQLMAASEALAKISQRMRQREIHDGKRTIRHSTSQNILIVYPNHVQPTLDTTNAFISKYCLYCFSHVHVLPYHPSTSYEGYAITDYVKVDDTWGGEMALTSLLQSNQVDLLADIVLNHCSSQHPWIEDVDKKDYVLSSEDVISSSSWTSTVKRARDTDLFSNIHGRLLWTTYSPDLVDLAICKNPRVLVEIVEIMEHEVMRGASILRLDAFVYVWKKLGTNCVNVQPESSRLVSLFRKILPSHVQLLPSITNVTQQENYEYIREPQCADYVYLLPLSGMTLYSILSKSPLHLMRFLRDTPPAPLGKAYVPMTASHDGIGLSWLRDLLKPEELETLMKQASSTSCRLSSRCGAPWELNATYFEACGRDVRKFILSQVLTLVVRGVPATYFASLVAGENDERGVEVTGDNRAINRGRFDMATLEGKLRQGNSTTAVALRTLVGFLRRRRFCCWGDFDVNADMVVEEEGENDVLAIRRGANTLCLFNFSDEERVYSNKTKSLGENSKSYDIITMNVVEHSEGVIIVHPWQSLVLHSNPIPFPKYDVYMMMSTSSVPADSFLNHPATKIIYWIRHGEGTHQTRKKE